MTGTFILSLDTEIAWGTYTHLEKRAPAFDRYPELLNRLIQQLDIYEISATWAVVGHLLLSEAETTSVPQPHYRFAANPDSRRMDGHPPTWFRASYIADAIQSMRQPQDIGTHTFTHVLASEVSRELFAAQLAEAVRVHTAKGLSAPRALVYPQNRVSHTDLLPDYGLITYRGTAHDWYARLPAPLRRPAHLLDRTLGIAPPTYAPADCLRSDGLVNLPASQFLMSYDGIRQRIPTSARVKQARLGIKRAIQRGEVFHLWFHPFNLGSSDAMFDALSQILSMVWEARARGLLHVMTMTDMATEIAGLRSG
ncbi:MAG: polysaccharide deacetylase family protein [Chloroflexota bacterium]